MFRHGRAIVRLAAVGMLVLVGAVLAATPPANASDPGYPYASYYGPGSDWTQSVWTDPNGGRYSPYSYVYRNCTDYVAWRLASLGVPVNKVNYLGNAKDWGTNASGRGLTVDGSAEVGAVAVKTSGTYGHVAYVEAVYDDGKIKVSEYNWPISGGYDGAYHERTGTPSALGFSQFIHYDSLMTNPPSSGSGTGPLSVTVGLAVSPASPHMYEPLTFTYTVRTYASAVSVKRFTVAVRNPSGGNLDVPCNNGEGVALAANTSWMCTAYLPTGYGAAMTYTYWADWEDYAGAWHVGQLGAQSTFTVGQPYTLSAVQPVSVGPSGEVPMYAGLSWSYRVKNTSGAAVSAQRFVVAVRGPGNVNLDNTCDNGNGVALQPNDEWVCNVYLSQGYGLQGTYTFWADWQDYAGTWHVGQLGSTTSTLVVTTAPTLTTTVALSVGPSSSLAMYQPTYWSYRVKNTSGSWTTIKRLEVAVRTPGGGAMDVPCDNGDNVTIGPGEEWSCSAYNMSGYGSTGPFTFWADWLGYDGSWHPGALSSTLTMNVGPPNTLSPWPSISVSPGNTVAINTPVTYSFTAKNTSGGGASVLQFAVGVHGPSGQVLDVNCANGNGVALAAGATFTCTASVPSGYTSPGTYTYWANWLDYGGTWHSWQLSPPLPLYVLN